MKIFIFVVIIVLLGLWALMSVVLLGLIQIPGFSLKLPTTTAEYGDSLGLLNGLFSSIAVLLALVAVLLQGKELKAATKAQKDQASALELQLEHQKILNEQQQLSNKLNVIQAKQQFYHAEISRMDLIMSNIEGNFDKKDLFDNCLNKKNRYINHVNNLDDEMNVIA